MKIRRSKRVKKRIRRRAGSLTPQQSAKKIQSAFRENTTRRKASALRQRHSAKTIQRKIHQAFDFTRDNCAVCTEKLALTSKVSTLSCKHGLHKQCLKDLKNSQAFKDKTKRRCPICRTEAKELQIEEETQLSKKIKSSIDRVIIYTPFIDELVSPANIQRFKQELFTKCESDILQHIGIDATGEEVLNIVMRICGIVRSNFFLLNKSLTTINNIINTKKGVFKQRITTAELIIVKNILNQKILSYVEQLMQYNITIPTTIATQIRIAQNITT